MENAVFHLGNCSTCQRIISDLAIGGDFINREIKSDPITPEEIDYLAGKSGSYESLFSRRAMKYKSMGLAEKKLTEE